MGIFHLTRGLMRRAALTGLSALMLAGCGTTYAVPVASDTQTGQADAMFAAAAEQGAGTQVSEQLAMTRYARVVARVEPVAEEVCRREMAALGDFDCDVRIQIDREMDERNAYQTYDDRKRPTIAFTVPMIRDARNEDELAFVLGHEVGHHVGQHIRKQQQQAVAGALIMAAVTGYAQASASQANPYRYTGGDSAEMERNMALGMQAGHMAYSQTYELEADVIGTYIARTAGYDPVKGAQFFARPEAKRHQDGTLSFWGTHPPDRKRLATVIAADAALERDGGLTRRD